jgi:hypothetical protein
MKAEKYYMYFSEIGYELTPSGSGMSLSEPGGELLGSVKEGAFHEQLNKYWFFKKGFVSWSWLAAVKQIYSLYLAMVTSVLCSSAKI